MERFERLMALTPRTWTCVRCQNVFPNLPYGEQPEAVEIRTDPKTGWQSYGGDICRQCTQPIRALKEEDAR